MSGGDCESYEKEDLDSQTAMDGYARNEQQAVGGQFSVVADRSVKDIQESSER